MDNSKQLKIKYALLAAGVIIACFGLMFMLSAAEIVVIFKVFTKMDNMLLRYIFVILTMSIGIMLFSNVASTLPNKKIRNGTTIGVTAFAFIMTLPLVYVFCAIFSAHNGNMGAVGELMMLDQIVAGFIDWFGNGAFVQVVYVFMLILSIIFLAVPLVTGVLTVKGKAIKIGKNDKGQLVSIIELPIITKQNNAKN
ncbi:MAG: hypothetical protein R3Y23_00820 [Bacillota bacterium]